MMKKSPKKTAKSFPIESSTAYKATNPPQNLKGGSAGLKPVPVRKKAKKK